MQKIRSYLKNNYIFRKIESTSFYHRYAFIRWKWNLQKKYYNKTSCRISNHPNKTIVTMIDGKIRHGGLADRLRNVIGVYYHCLQYGYNYKIYWKYPFKLTNYLIPNEVNWEIQENEISYNIKDAIPQVYYAYWIDKTFGTKSEKDTKKILNANYKQIHFYGYLHTPTQLYGTLFNKLFKISPRLQSEIELYTKPLGHEYISITFRFQNLLGDFKEADYPTLDESSQQELINKCKQKLSEIVIDKTQKVLVTSDSTKFLSEVSSFPFVYIVSGELTHMDYFSAQSKTKDEYEIHKKAFIDFFMISNAKKIYLLQTGSMFHSLFPYTAALIGNKEYQEITF